MIGKLINTYKKAEAAAILQSYLEMLEKRALLDGDPKKHAAKLVSLTWDVNKNICEGYFGVRPHKISIVASALSLGLLLEDEENKDGLALILAMVMAEIQRNSDLYPFNRVDKRLIQESFIVLRSYMDEQQEIMDEIDDLLNEDSLCSAGENSMNKNSVREIDLDDIKRRIEISRKRLRYTQEIGRW